MRIGGRKRIEEGEGGREGRWKRGREGGGNEGGREGGGYLLLMYCWNSRCRLEQLSQSLLLPSRSS